MGSTKGVAPTVRPDELSSALGTGAAMISLALVLLAAGFSGFTMLPEVTGETEPSSPGWVLAVPALAALLGAPVRHVRLAAHWCERIAAVLDVRLGVLCAGSSYFLPHGRRCDVLGRHSVAAELTDRPGRRHHESLHRRSG